MPSGIFEPGTVVVVPFPFTDRAASKRRPALVLSTVDFQADTSHAVLAMITTGAASSWASDVPLSDLDGAGLTKPCVVRLKLFTLEAALIDRPIGRLCPADWRQVRDGLSDLLPS